MNRSILTVSTLALTCAMAFVVPANASGDAARGVAHVQRVAHHHMIPGSAEALSPSAPALKLDDDADGLSRNTSECNRGCIDN